MCMYSIAGLNVCGGGGQIENREKKINVGRVKGLECNSGIHYSLPRHVDAPNLVCFHFHNAPLLLTTQRRLHADS